MNSDRPDDGAGPRGTLPLGPGPFPSPAAPRAERETIRPPALRPRRVSETEPQGSAQLPERDAALAPRAPALRAPVRLGGRWRAPSLAGLALARLTHRPAVRGVLAVLAVLGPVALAVKLSAHPAALS